MSADTHMTRFEKLALTSAVSGAVFNVFLYGVGAKLSDAGAGTDLYTVRVVAAIIQAAAFDLVAIATVLGMRAGRRGRWSLITAWASALVSAAIALDVAGVMDMPFLHAANALIVLAFTLHLLTPKELAIDERDRLTFAEQEVTELRQVLAGRDRLLATAEQRANRAEQALTFAEQESEQTRQALTATGRQLADAEQALNRRTQALTTTEQQLNSLQHELTRRPPPETVEVIYVARYRLTWQQFEQAVRALAQEQTFSLSTIRRQVAKLGAPMIEEVA